MDQNQDTVALLSIHPHYAESILAGTKKVEFRKSSFSRNVSHVVIYATKPISAVIGTFETDGMVQLHPRKLWDKFSKIGGIDRDAFDSYYSGKTVGCAIRIKNVKRLKNPLPLQRLSQSHPPQNFHYLDRESLRCLSL